MKAWRLIKKYFPVLQIGTGIGILCFWTVFLIFENSAESNDAVYLAFERSFLLPDIGWLVPVLFLSAWLNLLRKSAGILLTAVSAGGLIFLGLIDIGFNAAQGIYSSAEHNGAMALIINIYCLLFGAASALFAYRLMHVRPGD